MILSAKVKSSSTGVASHEKRGDATTQNILACAVVWQQVRVFLQRVTFAPFMEYILKNTYSHMGIIIFCVLLLNVIGQMCGGSSNWGE